jgi:1-deoxy-D-xylulose-5-phosphate reductoisomerase
MVLSPNWPVEGEERVISILGSTGSIGVNTLDLIQKNTERFKVEALTALSSTDLLAQQAIRTGARLAVIGEESCYKDLKKALAGSETEVAAGKTGLIEAASRFSDILMAAIVGSAGLEPTLAGIRRGALVGLANKECLVCAGELMLNEISVSGAKLLPVDSEHNAIFQVFDFSNPESVEKIILTASGGPFWSASLEQMKLATPEEAIAHPNWKMGSKISVDSATMMNKGLEIIEAHYLFGLEEDSIEVVVHPESIVHSLVSYVDGSLLAQMGKPDMRIPIASILNWPQRLAWNSPKLDLADIGKLTFFDPDVIRFPAINLAREALRAGGCLPTILNASNEIAVNAFLAKKIGFLDITRLVEATMERLSHLRISNLEDVFAVDLEVREKAKEILRSEKHMFWGS